MLGMDECSMGGRGVRGSTQLGSGTMKGVMFHWVPPSYSLSPCPLHPPVFLSFFGIASIGLSCLVALFLYHVVFGVQYLGILNGVAAFVIVGIGELPPLPSNGLPT